MLNRIIPIFLLLLVWLATVSAQVPLNIGVQILKAEDARRYDGVLGNLMKSPNADIRKRAALAAGRIGKEEAITTLVGLLEKDASADVRTMAAFALGEVESIKAADAILKALNNSGAVATQAETRAVASVPVAQVSDTLPNGRVSARADTLARLVEAAGKIAAANPKDEKSKALGAAIVKVLEAELNKQSAPDTEVIRLGLTAVLRARPDGSEDTVRKFLAFTDPNIVADALNTLARLRAKNANRDARDLLATNMHAVVRANAARVLGAAGDTEAVDILLKATTSDDDQRVRVSAIRALGNLKIGRPADRLEEYMDELVKRAIARGSKSRPTEQNEILEITTTLGNIRAGKPKQGAGTSRLYETAPPNIITMFNTPETSMAGAKISPESFMIGMLDRVKSSPPKDWRAVSKLAQGIGVVASLSKETYSKDLERYQLEGREILNILLSDNSIPAKAIPDVLRAYATFKSDDLEAVLREQLASSDVFIRDTAAELLAENFPSQTVRTSLENAFKKALTTDKQYDDAQLAMLDAMAKINKAASLDTIYLALDAPDYLVRKKALELLDDKELIDKNP
ncbi:MAG TPA: HEAT repeat domain-containing protein, partial [Pyrinomonadaceae bacterium]|nr:HEAT repeat domain-containing protein [Pyrinomonadaceae bacterium]